MRQTGFAYAQTRMQARFATCPTRLDWQIIETGRNLAQAIEAARRGVLSRCVTQLGRDSGRTAIESALRLGWVEMVDELVRWAPSKWRPALMWMVLLPNLRVLAAGIPPSVPGAAALVDRVEAGAAPGEAWRQGWIARLPGRQPELHAALAPLTNRFLEGPPQPAVATETLHATLERLFRTRAQEPIAAFAWLGLIALEVERLRGALLLAQMFPGDDSVEVP